MATCRGKLRLSPAARRFFPGHSTAARGGISGGVGGGTAHPAWPVGGRGGPARGVFVNPPTAIFAAKGGCAMRTLTPVLCTSGLAAEAKVARSAGFQVIVGAGDPRRTAELVELAARQAKFLISFGVAGGLAPHLRSGQVILSAEVIGGDRRWHPNQRF